MIPVKKSLGEILGELRRESGLTLRGVCAELAGRGFEIQPAGVSKWEKDMTMPNAAQFLALCEIYSVSDIALTFAGRSSPLAGLNAAGRRLVEDYVRVLAASGLYSDEEPAAGRVLPLYDLAVSAGTGQFLDSEGSVPIDAENAPQRADFALRVAGDSMEPVIADGAVLWVRRCAELAPGRIGIFVLNGQAYCKRLRRGARGAELVSENPAYAPISPREGDSLRVLGEVIGAAVGA